jgi:tryptophan-rich sensory protein
MLPSWLVIATVAILLAVVINRLSTHDIQWFRRLQRPRWLTFEGAIPFIWIGIFICGGWSAYAVWAASQSWGCMAFYALLEAVILAYTPVMCKLRSLTVGTVIGGLGWVLGLILAWWIWPISTTAVWLLLPYLVWSPIGTYVTWQMIGLNPGNA